MKIRKHLGSDLPRREVADNGNREGPFRFIQCLMRQAAARRRSDMPFRKVQFVTLAYTPLLERGLGENYTQ